MPRYTSYNQLRLLTAPIAPAPQIPTTIKPMTIETNQPPPPPPHQRNVQQKSFYIVSSVDHSDVIIRIHRILHFIGG